MVYIPVPPLTSPFPSSQELIPDGQLHCLWMKESEPLPNSGCGAHCQPWATTFLLRKLGFGVLE